MIHPVKQVVVNERGQQEHVMAGTIDTASSIVLAAWHGKYNSQDQILYCTNNGRYVEYRHAWAPTDGGTFEESYTLLNTEAAAKAYLSIREESAYTASQYAVKIEDLPGNLQSAICLGMAL